MPKYFPIKTATACQLKWTWSTLFLNDGTTSSCHRVGRHQVALEDFDNFHNTPMKIDQRNTMLEGKWPQPLPYMQDDEGCRYCQKIEEAGGQSDRMYHIQIPDLSPPELEYDPLATNVTPRILEVFLSNTCNLSCTYCNAYNSSKIEYENKKFGVFEKNGLKLDILNIDRNKNKEYIERFFTWLETHSGTLRRLHLLGGEPLYQKEFVRCLNFFETHPNPQLELNVITNLMIDADKLTAFVEQWRNMIATRKIKRFDITVSLDCWGEEQEYARTGLKMDVIERNMEILLKQPWLYININSMLSPLTIRTFPDLVAKINTWKKIKKIDHCLGKVFSPDYHNPDIFGPDFWQEDFNRALDIMPQDSWQEKNVYQYLQGMVAQVQKTCRKPELIVKLQTHLDELDRRRGTNWKKLFSYVV